MCVCAYVHAYVACSLKKTLAFNLILAICTSLKRSVSKAFTLNSIVKQKEQQFFALLERSDVGGVVV